jgi:hypothetical protein
MTIGIDEPNGMASKVAALWAEGYREIKLKAGETLLCDMFYLKTQLATADY